MSVRAMSVPRLRGSAVRAEAGAHAVTFALALACAAALWHLGLTGFAFTDYDDEAAPAFLALLRGDIAGFLGLAPAYGGSLVLRAPFAVAPTTWGGGELAAFRAGAVPGLVACALLATVVVGRMRAAGRPRLDRAVVLVALAGSPFAMRALEVGHPEELLGAALCVAAVLAARTRPLLAAVLLGLAVANKPWALIAAPVVLASVPAAALLRSAVLSAAVAVAVLSPLILGATERFTTVTTAAAKTDAVFQPWQVWYLLGEDGRVQASVSEGTRVLRHAPEWVTAYNRPLILLMAPAITLLWWLRRGRRGAAATDALALLALLFHLRCLIDPWNFTYYALPAVLALAAWEGLDRPRRVPALTLAYVAAAWSSFEVAPDRVSPDLLSVLYLGWAVPMAAVVAALVFMRPERRTVVKDATETADPSPARPRC